MKHVMQREFAESPQGQRILMEERLEQLEATLADQEKQPVPDGSAIDATKAEIAELKDQRDIGYVRDFLAHAVTRDAQHALTAVPDLLEQFRPGKVVSAVVLVLDLRSSVTVMENSNPSGFAELMVEMVRAIETCAKEHYGIFDKFTGDGAMVYFPEFFTGAKAPLHALHCAHESINECRKIWSQRSEDAATRLVVNTGMAAGMEEGEVTFVRLAGSLSLVGTPVVLANRFSSAEQGKVVVGVGMKRKLSPYLNEVSLKEDPHFRIKGVVNDTKVWETELLDVPNKTVLSFPPWWNVK